MTEAPGVAPRCYRHKDTETWVSCSRCDRSICPECMRDAAVGFHCPECVKEGARTMRRPMGAFGGSVSRDATVTRVLIGLCVAVYALQLVDTSVVPRFAALGAQYDAVSREVTGVVAGQWYRLLTAAFLHASLIHILFNMFALFSVGSVVETALGRWRFITLYVVAALGGSVASYATQDPVVAQGVNGATLALTTGIGVGASGAVFGLFAAFFVIAKKVRADTSQIVTLIVINLVIGAVIPRIDNAAHIGGLVTGFALTTIYARIPRGPRRPLLQGIATVVVVALLITGTLVRSAQLREEFPVLDTAAPVAAPR